MADEAHNENDLLGSTDPRLWAERFIDLFGGNDSDKIDEDLLIGWFANAFQAKETELEAKARAESEQGDAPEERPHRFSDDELLELVFLVGGAASGACLRAAPDLVMPSEDVVRDINSLLAERGLPTGTGQEATS